MNALKSSSAPSSPSTSCGARMPSSTVVAAEHKNIDVTSDLYEIPHSAYVPSISTDSSKTGPANGGGADSGCYVTADASKKRSLSGRGMSMPDRHVTVRQSKCDVSPQQFTLQQSGQQQPDHQHPGHQHAGHHHASHQHHHHAGHQQSGPQPKSPQVRNLSKPKTIESNL